MMPQAFSTDELAMSATREAWRRYMGEVYFKLDIETDADAIVGRLRKSAFENLHVSSFEASAQRVKRSKRLAADDNIESFCFVLPSKGSFTCRQRGKETKAESGDVYILNAAEAYEVDIVNGSEMVCVTVSCDLVRPRIRGIDDLCARGGIADPVLSSTLRHMIDQSLRQTPLTPPWRTESLLIELIDAMIVGNGQAYAATAYSNAVATCLLARLRSVIQLHLHDAGFGIEKAAHACKVSSRHLQAALQRQGTTFGRELVEARLVRARCLLASSHHRREPIGVISASCGFASQAHFATRYRERFGHPPSSEPFTR